MTEQPPDTGAQAKPAGETKTAGQRKQKKPDWLQRLTRLKPGAFRRAVILVVVVALFLGIGSAVSRIWTNFLWYQEVGYTTVFWTPFVARLCVGVFFAVVFFILFYGSLWLARKISPRLLAVRDAEDDNVFEWATRRRWTRHIVLAFSIILSIVVGIGYSSRWQEILLFLHRTNFGYTDPQFHKDASFFVFTMPVWSTLVNFVGLAMLFTFVATAFTYVVDRALVLNSKNRITLAPHVKAHLSAILAIAMVAKAGDYMLQTWELDFSTRGVIFGASYTDVHASLPVLHFLAIVSLIAAAIFLVNIRYKGWRLPALAIAVMFLTWALAGKAYPAIIQSYKVSPNEISAESPYIAKNIDATRWAFNLSNVTTVPLQATTDLTAADVTADQGTISNVRLWEPRPALATYNQIQTIRLYYVFKDVDVDRYLIDGQYRQVLISARELDQSQLDPKAQSWVNLTQTYTHGYGFVLSPGNVAGGDGLPVLAVSNIPPSTTTDLKITRPEIYYGEIGNQFVVVRTTTKEFDYPQGDTLVYTSYQGDGGVPIGDWQRRLAFAFRFNSLRLFFSGSFTSDSRIMYRRTLEERVQALAPFLTFDGDPYLVLRDDGSLVWMWDAYTTTDRFPYSQPQSGLNYMRNAIKVVINAYDGKTTFYQMDSTDAIANTWGKVYKGLFTPGDQMPADLRAHMRYPEDYYSIQASVLATYHMTDPQVFYNQEDVWEIPTELYQDKEIPVVPYYEVLTLPGETSPEFALLLPFTPLSKKNMTALMVGRMDGQHYGQVEVIDFPNNKLVYGPSQIEARISNDPVISSQLTLWNQSGSQVIRGNLLVLPVKQSVMYFEPVYLQAEQSPIPELTRVIAAYGDQVVMEPTLGDALAKIFGQPTGGETTTTTIPGGTTTTIPGGTTTTIPGGTTTTTPGGTTTTSTTLPPTTTTTLSGTTTTLPASATALIALANQHYQAAIEAQRQGDWATYGAEIQALGEVLAALEALQK